MTERQGQKMQTVWRDFLQKIGFPGVVTKHQWIHQRLAYKIGKCDKVLLRYMEVLEFKTLIVPRAIGNPRR